MGGVKMDNYFLFLELGLFFVFLPIVYNVSQAIDLSKVFKKGYTPQIRAAYIIFILIVSYLLSNAITSILELSYNIIN